MDYRRFSIHLKEASGLDCTKLFLKRPVYATVSIVGGSPLKQRTLVGTYLGNNNYNNPNPTWGSRSSMRFYVEDSKLQQNHLVLMVQILRKRVLGSDKVIGEVCVPLKELYDNGGGSVNSTNHIFHQVVKPFRSTRPLGYLYFTYEFGNIIRAAVVTNNNDGNGAAAAAYPLMRSHSRVTPSAPCLENSCML